MTTDTSDANVAHVNIVLGQSSSIVVQVVDHNGAAIEGATLSASDIGVALSRNLGGSVEYLGDGRYRMTRLVPGVEYFLSVNAIGYRGYIGRGRRNQIVLEVGEERDLGTIELSQWGKEAVPELIEQLLKDGKQVRAAKGLGEIGPGGGGPRIDREDTWERQEIACSLSICDDIG